MNKAPTPSTASGALGGQFALPLAQDFSAPPANLPQALTSATAGLARRFYGPSNNRQERVLVELMKRRRLTNNDVRTIGGALNGPHIIKELRGQGLCDQTELCMEWIKCVDRDGKRVRYGEYFLTEAGIAKVKAWEDSRGQEFQQ